MRAAMLTLAWLLSSSPAFAEWQIQPFLGTTFGGATTFVDLEHAVGHANLAIGVSGVWLGDVIGIEADLGHMPGFFQKGDQRLLLGSHASTLTGNIVVAAPRRLTQYTLRPYLVGGGGMMHVNSDAKLSVLSFSETLPAMDIGGGVTGFLTNRIGLNWGLRYFRRVGPTSEGPGPVLADQQLSFWRANMALAVRY